jgi:hypothetical protein
VVERQKNDSADNGGTGAVNAVDVKTGHAGAAEKVEQPAADDRADDAEQNVDDGALAVVVTILLATRPSPSPSRIPRSWTSDTVDFLLVQMRQVGPPSFFLCSNSASVLNSAGKGCEMPYDVRAFQP